MPSTILNHLFVDEPTPYINKENFGFFKEITYPIILLAISMKSVVDIAVNA